MGVGYLKYTPAFLCENLRYLWINHIYFLLPTYTKNSFFLTSVCSAGVSPAWVSRSMAGETPALQQNLRKSDFRETLVLP